MMGAGREYLLLFFHGRDRTDSKQGMGTASDRERSPHS